MLCRDLCTTASTYTQQPVLQCRMTVQKTFRLKTVQHDTSSAAILHTTVKLFYFLPFNCRISDVNFIFLQFQTSEWFASIARI